MFNIEYCSVTTIEWIWIIFDLRFYGLFHQGFETFGNSQRYFSFFHFLLSWLSSLKMGFNTENLRLFYSTIASSPLWLLHELPPLFEILHGMKGVGELVIFCSTIITYGQTKGTQQKVNLILNTDNQISYLHVRVRGSREG